MAKTNQDSLEGRSWKIYTTRYHDLLQRDSNKNTTALMQGCVNRLYSSEFSEETETTLVMMLT